MSAIRRGAARVAARIAVLVAALWVAACQPTVITGGGPGIDPTRPVPVALLVPAESGQAGDQVLARSLENAARLAIADLDGVQIDLRVYSTAGDPTRAAAAATRAVNEGARIILGPVYAAAASAAGNAVRGRGVNVLAFSNNTDIAGGNVFILGNTFENRADRLVSYAVAQGRGSIFVAHGSDAAELKGREAISAAVARHGATLAGTASFEMTQEGVVNAVPGIADQVRETGANALFFTSGTAGALPILSQLLPENGIDREAVQFIGLQRWDIPSSALELPGLQGGWFALPDPALTGQFRGRYEAAYGDAPHPIGGLAYDGIAAIGALVSAGQSDALAASGLTQGSGFLGVNGVFRLRRDGTNERGLAVARIRDRQVDVIDPAPRSFGGAGF